MPHILLAEDDLIIGEITKSRLEEISEHKITWLDHGKDAQVALSEGHAYDCVLLNLRLPGVQGLDLLKTLRAYDPITPVIIVTANDLYDTRIQCLDAGATDFLAKPVEPSTLLACIDACLAKRS